MYINRGNPPESEEVYKLGKTTGDDKVYRQGESSRNGRSI